MNELVCSRCGNTWGLHPAEDDCLACDGFREESLCAPCYVIVAWAEIGKPEGAVPIVDPTTGTEWQAV